MRKIMSLTLAAVMVLSMAACSSAGEGQSAATTTVPTTMPAQMQTATTTQPTTAVTTVPSTAPTTAPTTEPTTAPTTEPTTEPTVPTTVETQPGHVHSYTAKQVNATCTQKGCTRYTCACGHSYDENVTKALGHSYGSWNTVKPATCEQEGQRQRTCSRCANVQSETVKKSGHIYGNPVFVPAADLCAGSGEYVSTCTVCGHEKKEIIHGEHVYGEWQYVASTYMGKNIFDEPIEVWTHSARFRECTKCQYKDYEYFKDHRCEYGAVFETSVLTQIDTGCKNRVINRYTCSVCGYAWEKEALDPRTRKPLYGEHKYEPDVRELTQLTDTTDGYTLITNVCSVCNDKKWEVRDILEVPSTHEAWKTKYSISVRFSDSYDHNLKMSGTGDPDPRWTEHPEWLRKYTNFKYSGETGELLEYTVIWWSKNGNRYETVINIQDCYELFLETGMDLVPEGKKPENCILKFNCVPNIGLHVVGIGWS